MHGENHSGPPDEWEVVSVPVPEAPIDRSSAWWAVSGVVAVYFAFGLAIGLMPPMVDEISADLELSRSAMGSILGAWALIYVFTAVPGGAMVERLGLRRAMLLGGVSVAASLLLRALATGGVSLFLAVAIFGIGGPLVSISTPKLVASLFDEEARRLPTGLGVAAPGIGSALGFALPNPVLLPLFDDSWRAVLVSGGLLTLVCCAYWIWATRASLAAAPPAEPIAAGTFGRLLGLTTMRWILVISLFSFAFSHGLNGWLPEILADSGLGDDAAGYVAALSTVLGIAGSLTIARLVPGHRRSVALAGVYGTLAICALGMATLAQTGVVVATLALGFVRAGSIPLMFLELMDDRDISVADMGAATGLFFAVGEIGGFGGPWSIGLIADRTDGFTASTIALALIASAACASALGLSRHRRSSGQRPMSSR